MTGLRRLGMAISGAGRTLVPRCAHVRHVVLLAVGFLFAASGVAYAYFSATSSGTYGLTTAGRLTAPASFSATATSASQVTLTWSAPPSTPPGAYSYVLTGTLGTASTCSASMATAVTSCSVDGLSPQTSYTWTLAVEFHTWLSTKKQAQTTTKILTPSLVCVGPIQTWTSPATKQVTYPSCVKTTDLLVLILARSHNNDTSTASCPTGWSRQATRTAKSGGPGGVHGFLEVCSDLYASGTSVTMTVQGTANRGSSAEIAAFRHVTTATPFDKTAHTTKLFTTATAAGVGTFAAPSFTTTTAGDLALSVVMENSDTTTIPTLTLKAGTTQGFSSHTSGGMQSTESDANNFATKAVATPGTVSFPTWASSVTNTTDVWIGESLALRADPPSTATSPSASILAAPSVTALSPATGPVAGGTTVTITGTGFTTTATVSFGTTPAASVAVTGPTLLTVVTPAHAQGPVAVTVTTPAGTSSLSAADQFTYITGSVP